MATLKGAGSATGWGNVLTASATLRNLPTAAGTIVALTRFDPASEVSYDVCGLTTGTGNTPSDFFHTIFATVSGGVNTVLNDDDGVTGATETPSWTFGSVGDWFILGVSWPGGVAIERFHHKNLTAATAWGHSNAAANNAGNRSAPGSGFLRVGYMAETSGGGEFGLVGMWVGTQLTDLQIEELSVGSHTSAWWNCSGGQPTALVELNTTTPTDIGSSASSFNSIGGLTLTGGNPTGWTFDGRGSSAGNLAWIVA